MPNGNLYEGNFKENVFNGIGKLTYGKNSPYQGDYYEGEFKEGRYCGLGRYSWSEGPEYFGQWVDNRRNGKGK